MAYIVMAHVVMAYIVMAHIVMAYIVMAHIVMTYPLGIAGHGLELLAENVSQLWPWPTELLRM